MRQILIANRLLYCKRIVAILIISIVISVIAKANPKAYAIDRTYENSIEFVSGNWAYEDNSESELPYLVYVPDRVLEDTKIVLFLHGNGDVGSDWKRIFDRYEFVKNMYANSYIFIIPLEDEKCNWQKDIDKLDIVLNEVCTYCNAKREGNVYIAGVSAGADAISDVAKKIDFQGAIYMAGSLKGTKLKMSARQVADLWKGKEVYYFRDNLQDNGGYNYDEKFISRLSFYSKAGILDFEAVDLDWNHSHCLVDAVFDSDYRYDANGKLCHGLLDSMFLGNVEYEYGKMIYRKDRITSYVKEFGLLVKNAWDR